ncbi:MAG: hypothetical protein HFG70_05740 [Hungatella sp.]|nr:hypothetical protein [Hungatella sp.]
MKIDHIGYAVKKIEQAQSAFEKLGFRFEQPVEDRDRNIKIVFGEKDGYRLELVCPLDKKKPSPIDTYISNLGPTPYHICYQSEALEEEVRSLEKQGFKVIIEPIGAAAFGGRRVVFLMNLGLGLIEIVEL